MLFLSSKNIYIYIVWRLLEEPTINFATQTGLSGLQFLKIYCQHAVASTLFHVFLLLLSLMLLASVIFPLYIYDVAATHAVCCRCFFCCCPYCYWRLWSFPCTVLIWCCCHPCCLLQVFLLLLALLLLAWLRPPVLVHAVAGNHAVGSDSAFVSPTVASVVAAWCCSMMSLLLLFRPPAMPE